MKYVDKIAYTFSAKIWQHNSSSGWFFVSLPAGISEEIRANLRWQEEGWGRMKAIARINDHSWNTSIWYDKKEGAYLLPLKSSVRSEVGLFAGDLVSVEINI